MDINKTLYLDFDGTVVNSKKRLAEIYNIEYDGDIDWKSITTWSAGIDEDGAVEKIFGHDDFHNDELELFDDIIEVLVWLKMKGWKIVLYTKGILPNISNKSKFIDNKLGELLDGWIFVGETGDLCMGKNQYDMSPENDGDITVLLDDHIKNLTNSGALYNVCAKLCGQDEEWNRDWQGISIDKWDDLYKVINTIENYETLIHGLKK